MSSLLKWESAALLVLAVSGCSSKTQDPANPQQVPAVQEPAAAETTPVEQPAEPAAEATTTSEPLLTDVPALELTPLGGEVKRKSKRLNAAALKLHKQQEFAAAAAGFIESLAANPGNLTSRFNLACAYARAGDEDRALAVLAQLKEAGCILCLKRLLAATRDQDLASLHDDPRFTALVAGVEVVEPDYRAAAIEVARALANRSSKPLLDAIEAGRSVEFEYIWEDMSDEGDQEEPFFEMISTEKDARKLFARPVDPDTGVMGWTKGKLHRCKGNCCSFEVNSSECMRVNVIQRICFWPISSTEAVPVYVDVFKCGV